MGAVLWLTTGSALEWLAASALERATRLTWVVFAGAAAYFTTLRALGFRLRDFNRRAAE